MFIADISNGNKTKSAFQRGMVMLVMSALLLTSVFSVGALNKKAVINVDGKTLTMSTMTTDATEILSNADVEFSQQDRIITSEKDGIITIEVVRAFNVYTDIDGIKMQYSVTGGTVEELIDTLGITVTENHMVFPNVDTPLTENLIIAISEYRTVNISADGITKEEKVPVGNVKTALKYLNIPLNKEDILNHSPEEQIFDGMDIVVTRISYKDVTSTEKIPFETEETYSDKLAEGKTKVKVKGQDGSYKSVVRQTLVNGEVTDYECIHYEVVKEAVNEVVVIGTKKSEKATETPTETETADNNNDTSETEQYETASAQTLSGNVFYDESGNAVSYTAAYHGSGTAYTAPYGSLTATGNTVYVGGVAVNPNIIPYGSKLYIVADDGFVYGYATAIDTGGALMDGSAIVDVFYYTLDECYTFGRRDVTVYVLE